MAGIVTGLVVAAICTSLGARVVKSQSEAKRAGQIQAVQALSAPSQRPAAIAELERIADTFTPQDDPQDWLLVHGALAELRTQAAMKTSGDPDANLRRALGNLDEAVSVCSVTDDPGQYAVLCTEYMIVYGQLAKIRDPEANITQGMEWAGKASAALSRTEVTPEKAFIVKTNVCGVAADVGSIYQDASFLELAARSGESALEVLKTGALDGGIYGGNIGKATLLGNVARSYTELACLRGDATLGTKALSYADEAVRLQSPAGRPEDYAEAVAGRGYVRFRVGGMISSRASILDSINDFDSSLRVFTAGEYAANYAEVQQNLGLAHAWLAVDDGSSHWAQAINALKQSLVVYTPSTQPLRYAGVQNSLGMCYEMLSREKDERSNLKKAATCYQEALVYGSEDSEDTARLGKSLAGVQSRLDRLSN